MSNSSDGTVTRTALVTGASSGIGLATARRLLDRGYRVIGTSRDPEKVPDSARLEGLRYRALDLRDKGSIDGFAGMLYAEDTHVDILVNNAGESQSGPLEEIPLGALERIFQINVLGPVHLTQLLLPGMRQRGYGRVVMVSSMLASFPLAYRSSYVASKAAIEGFATAARFEMSPFGVWLTTVEPGSIKTGISSRRTKYVAADSPHAGAMKKMLKILDGNEREGVAPERVARTIVDAIEEKAPASLYAVGSNAPTVFALRRALPRGAVERVVGRMYGIRSRSVSS
jgi:NAD(P)-dependent dehydrogenase (short-subunit alcohol dehydrogenase family)